MTVILTNVIAKKIAARYVHTEAEIKIWEFQRWGVYERSKFKSPKPIGIFLPFLLVLLSYPTGFIKMLTLLQTDIKPTIRRVSKKRGGLERFYEITDWHNGWIPGVAIIVNLCLVFLPYLLGKTELTISIAKYSIYYAIWNMIPIGQLDGTKVLFINWKFWFFVWILILISLALIIPLLHLL